MSHVWEEERYMRDLVANSEEKRAGGRH